MSDEPPPRVATVRPARVWQPVDLMNSSARQPGFVQHSWASNSTKSLWLQSVIPETTLDATDPLSVEALSAHDEHSSTTAPDAEHPQEAPLAEVTPNPQERLTDELVERVRAEAYTQGVEESRASLRAEMDAELKSLQSRDESLTHALQAALDELKRSPHEFFEPLKRLSLHLAEQLVLGELGLDGKAIERLVQRCLDDLASHSESAILVELNPADLILFEVLHQRLGASGGPTLRLQADANLMPGSVRASANDAIIEDLIEHRLAALARDLVVDESRWKSQTAFEPERLATERSLGLRGVEDARPRMTTPASVSETSVIDELLAEREDDV
jgi:flagellar biosynthesis/type III secretory pathway protein FliH